MPVVDILVPNARDATTKSSALYALHIKEHQKQHDVLITNHIESKAVYRRERNNRANRQRINRDDRDSVADTHYAAAVVAAGPHQQAHWRAAAEVGRRHALGLVGESAEEAGRCDCR